MRNDNSTRLLIGDVYKSGQIIATVDLKVGLVGLVLPLRGLAQGSFYCQLNALVTQSVIVHNPRFVPDAVEFPDVPANNGLLVTNLFALPVHNVQSHSLTLEFRIEKPLGFDGEYSVREIRHPLIVEDNKNNNDNNLFSVNNKNHKNEARKKNKKGNNNIDSNYAEETQTVLAAGQTALLTLEIISATSANLPLYVPCRRNKPFTLVVIPARGEPVRTQMDIQCRTFNQSFHMSFLDHDNSVTQASVIFPYEFHSPQYAKQSEKNGKRKSPKFSTTQQKNVCASDLVDGRCENKLLDKSVYPTYPVLLTLHGSGITPSSHADSHKYMHPLK